jgi:translocation and assembly module TamB
VSVHWKRWVGGSTLLVIIALVVAVAAIFELGIADHWIRRLLISQIDKRTGGRAEIGSFHFDFRTLRAEIGDLTVHGREDPGTRPLFHADRVDVGIRIISFFEREYALDHLIVEHPAVVVRIDPDGHSNVPPPQVSSKRPWQQTLFQLQIEELALRDGSVILNDQRAPLSLEGRNFHFSLGYAAASTGPDSYVGNFTWQQVLFTDRRFRPVQFDLSTKFTLQRDAFAINELICKLPLSEIDLRSEMASYTQPDWNLHYRGRLSLAEVRTTFRVRNMPDGVTDFSGQARYLPVTTQGAPSGTGDSAAVKKDWIASGYYRARDVRMKYQWFHASGLETSGDYEVSRSKLAVRDMRARALGGTLDGRLDLDFHGFAFRTRTRLRGARLAAAFAALDNPDFPVKSLHWDALMEVDSVNTWSGGFKHFRTKGVTTWTPPPTIPAGLIPVTSKVDYDYIEDRKQVNLSDSEITTPGMHLDFDGELSAQDSALEASFSADDLIVWDDFISAIRGPESQARRVSGRVDWTGRVLGPIAGPTFVGHMHVMRAQYDTLGWDDLAGDFEYSPDGFSLKNTVIKRGNSSATVNLSLQLDGDWSFLPESSWSMDARVQEAAGEDLQAILGTNYPVSALLSGEIRGGGTREEPQIDANFVLANLETGSWKADSLSGQFHWQHDEIRLSHAELREGQAAAAGDIEYATREQRVQFDLHGNGIALDKIRALQRESVPVGGQLRFTLSGSGPIRALVANGELQVARLTVGTEQEGDFSAELASDGQTVHLTCSSEPTRERLHAEIDVGLKGDNPVSGRLSVSQLDLDPLIVAGLHLRQLTGHSSVDGQFSVSGQLRQPDSIEVVADVSRISFNYEFVQLTNDGDVRLTYRRNEVRIEQAHLHGTNTDLQVSGSARFDGEQPLHFVLAGGLNLRLVKGFLPALDANGRADLNVSVNGTMARPAVTGRATVRGASATYGDFPLGLSNVSGDFVFDKSRLSFDRVTAAAGGGQLSLSGGVNYGEGPVSYQVTATTAMVRIRYPAGMSWLANGTVQLSGTSTAGLISGRVEVQRLLFAQGVDVASFFASTSNPTLSAPTTSPFLQNLAFDVRGQTAPGASIQWAGAHVEIEGNVRLRGTWDRPILLGDIHLLGGEMPFRGNTFQLTRGDINFSNPFRLDPILDVEATSNISQYQVTIDFSGPASHLTFNYRSDPPLPDSDVVALLALGSPGESSGLRSAPGGSSSNYGATALLSEAISTGIGGRIEHLFGISQFRVDPFVGYTSTESNAAARVTIQEQLAHNLTVTYSSNAATSNQYQLIQVDYAVKRGLSIVFLRDVNGTYGLDIKWVKRLK